MRQRCRPSQDRHKPLSRRARGSTSNSPRTGPPTPSPGRLADPVRTGTGSAQSGPCTPVRGEGPAAHGPTRKQTWGGSGPTTRRVPVRRADMGALPPHSSVKLARTGAGVNGAARLTRFESGRACTGRRDNYGHVHLTRPWGGFLTVSESSASPRRPSRCRGRREHRDPGNPVPRPRHRHHGDGEQLQLRRHGRHRLHQARRAGVHRLLGRTVRRWGLDYLKTDGVVSPDQQDDARGAVVEVRGQDDDRDDQAEDVHGQAPRSRPAPAWPDRGRSWRRGPGGHTGSWMTW